jgi:GMP synthase (glutamine-hydrolysing)
MTKHRSQLKVLLLQIRDDAITCQEELDEFVRYSGLNAAQFTVLNVFQTPAFEPTCIAEFDALFVGGSSDASVTQPDRYPFVRDTERLLQHCLAQSVPVFASCFGFQAAVVAFGGQVIVDPDNLEMGTYPLQLTAAAAADPLFHDLPNGFWVVSGHKERAVLLPKDAILLASTDRCPYHAIQMAEKPFYAFQFHPEVSPADLRIRISRYCDRYLDSAATLNAILNSLQPETSIAHQLIANFVDRVLLPDGLTKYGSSRLPHSSTPCLSMPDTISITVKLFAAYQEVCGRSDLVMKLPAGSCVSTVRDRLMAEHPELEPWREVTRFGVNLHFVEPMTSLQDGDEVVLIPPVSGGSFDAQGKGTI